MTRYRSAIKIAVVCCALVLVAACSAGSRGDSVTDRVDPGSGLTMKPVTEFASPPPESLVDAARAEGGELVWYESTPDGLIPELVRGFIDRYPWAHVRHVALNQVNLNARVAQETTAGAVSADVAMNDAMPELAARGLLLDVDWSAIGISAGIPHTNSAVATAATIYCIQYNTNLIKENDAPRKFEDLLNPQWKGKIGYTAQPYPFAQLVAYWGSDRAVEYVNKFRTQDPKANNNPDALTQFVAAGDVPVAVSGYHQYLRGQEIKLPVGATIPDPTPLTLLYATIPKTSAHPNTAKLFINWLNSEEGQRAYTAVAKRGNPFYANSEYGRLVAGKQMATWDPNQAAEQTHWLATFADSLQR
jgi:iron(III) transport system substrate-binding protein